MNMIVYLICAACFVADIIGWKYSESIIRGHRSPLPLFVLFLSVTVFSAAAVRYVQAVSPDNLIGTALLKFSASLPTVLIAVRGYQSERNRFDFILLLAISFCLLADVSINLSIIAGGGLFAAGHLLFDAAFISEKKPSRKQITVWLAASLLGAACIFMVRDKMPGLLFCILAAAYLSILISTIVFSFPLPRIIFCSALVFAFSDIFMVFNILNDGSMLMKFMALLVYYISLFLYGAAIWQINHPIGQKG